MTYSDIGAPGPYVMPPVLWYENLGQHRIELRSGGYCRFDRQPTNHLHHHRGFHELCVVMDGTGTYRHRAGRFILERGTVLVADPDAPHEIASRSSRDLLLMYLSLRIRRTPLPAADRYEDALVGAFLDGHRVVAHGQHHVLPLIGLLDQRSGQAHDDAHRQHHALRLIACGIMAALLTGPPPVFTPIRAPASPLARALAFIDTNSHRVIAVGEIARHIGIGDRQLRRLFREHLGRTVVAIVNQRRLNYAAQHLLMGSEVGVAAQAIGIPSIAQFCRLFKCQFGMPPGVYGRRHRQDAEGPDWTEHGV